MNKQYENSPIIEAVCEFQLPSDSLWDITVPASIYEKIKDVYKTKEERGIQELDIKNTPQGLEQRLTTIPRIIFFADDKKTFVQVGPKLLAVNRLSPYQGWAKFEPEINRAFVAMTNSVDVKSFQKIGLRYINRIEIPGATVNLDDYFEFKPFLGKNLPQHMESFIVGFVVSFFDRRDICKIQITTGISEKQDTCTFILDIDYALAKPQSVGKDETKGWISNAHTNIESVFEGCITDRLRELFKEIKV